jgi:hypothetical protein
MVGRVSGLPLHSGCPPSTARIFWFACHISDDVPSYMVGDLVTSRFVWAHVQLCVNKQEKKRRLKLEQAPRKGHLGDLPKVPKNHRTQ